MKTMTAFGYKHDIQHYCTHNTWSYMSRYMFSCSGWKSWFMLVPWKKNIKYWHFIIDSGCHLKFPTKSKDKIRSCCSFGLWNHTSMPMFCNNEHLRFHHTIKDSIILVSCLLIRFHSSFFNFWYILFSKENLSVLILIRHTLHKHVPGIWSEAMFPTI